MRTILFAALVSAACASSRPAERPPERKTAARSNKQPIESPPATEMAPPAGNVNEGPSAPTEVPLSSPTQLP
jgi:hypothetical protein